MKTTGLNFAGKRIFLGLMLLIMSSMCFAQEYKFEKGLLQNWSLNLNAGPTIYWGYFSDSKSISTAFQKGISLGYGAAITKQISPIFAIRGQILLGTLKGRKDFYGDGSPADLNFTSDFAEGNLSAKISLTDLIGGYKPKRLINVYGLVGIGLSNFNGRVVNSVSGDTLYTIGNGNGKLIFGWEHDIIATGGVGFSVRLNKNLDFNVETSMKFFKTDKLGRVRGLLNYDMYSYSSVGITYKIGGQKESIQKKASPIVQKKINPVGNKPVEVKKEDAPVDIPVKVENKPLAEEKKEVPAKTVPAKPENILPVKQVKDTVKKPEVKKVEVGPIENEAKADGDSQFSGYKVQIIATLSPISIESVQQEYQIVGKIREDHFGKWYCFSVGDFQTFQAAHVYAKQLILKNKAKDAFVVKFKNGNRVGPVYK